MVGKGLDSANRPVTVGQDGQLGSDEGVYAKGAAGALTLTDSVAWIYAHAASVVNVTSAGISGTLSSVAIPAGGVWRCGRCSAVSLTSGEITAYYVGANA